MLYGVNVYAKNCLFLQRSRNKIFAITGFHKHNYGDYLLKIPMQTKF